MFSRFATSITHQEVSKEKPVPYIWDFDVYSWYFQWNCWKTKQNKKYFFSLKKWDRKGISVQFSRSVLSDSLWSHGLQHVRLPCPSPTPGACSNSRPSSWWYHPAISSSVIPFSSCLQSFPASGSFPMIFLVWKNEIKKGSIKPIKNHLDYGEKIHICSQNLV